MRDGLQLTSSARILPVTGSAKERLSRSEQVAAASTKEDKRHHLFQCVHKPRVSRGPTQFPATRAKPPELLRGGLGGAGKHV